MFTLAGVHAAQWLRMQFQTPRVPLRPLNQGSAACSTPCSNQNRGENAHPCAAFTLGWDQQVPSHGSDDPGTAIIAAKQPHADQEAFEVHSRQMPVCTTLGSNPLRRSFAEV